MLLLPLERSNNGMLRPMNARQNRYIYLLAVAVAFILMPFFFGFPQADGKKFILEDHGAIRYVSSYYYICAQISYGVEILGIVSFVISLIKLQREYGFESRIILVLMDPRFIKKLVFQIRGDFIAKLIFIMDLILFLFLLFFRW